jgi:hypothetical protein
MSVATAKKGAFVDLAIIAGLLTEMPLYLRQRHDFGVHRRLSG